MRPSYSGVLINLDSQAERLAAMHAGLEVAGLLERYERLSAVVGSARQGSRLSPGAMGCFLSHRRTIDMAKPGSFLHVLEDDVQLSRYFDSAVRAAIGAEALANYDIVFTGLIVVPSDLLMLRGLESAFVQNTRSNVPSFGILDLKGFMFAGTGSYLVNPASVAKVRRLLDDALNGPMNQPIDLLYRSAIWDDRLRAGCFFPFLSTTRVDAVATSTIRPADRTAQMLDVLSAAFYVDADYGQLARAIAPPAANKRLDVVTAALRVMFSEDCTFN
jgi:GR25 family glycosyltransferase involved in LPS biosynthesis